MAIFSNARTISMIRVWAVRNGALIKLLSHCVLMLMMISPFLAGGAFALIDLGQGIGRIATNIRLWDNPDSSEFFSFKIVLIPNMTLDLWGLFVGRIIGPEAAVNAFVVLTIILFYIGMQRLRAAIMGESSVIIGVGALFCILTFPFHMGFMNYMFGSALMLFALASLEKELREGDRETCLPFAIFQTLLLGAMFLSSIFPVVLYFIYLSARTGPALLRSSQKGAMDERWIWIYRHLPGGVLVFALLSFARLSQPNTPPRIDWLYIKSKLTSLVGFFIGTAGWRDAAVVVFCMLLAISIHNFRFFIPQILRLPVWMLWFFFAVAPVSLNGVFFVDTRLPPVILAITLAASTFTPRLDRSPSRNLIWSSAALLLLGICLKIIGLYAEIAERSAVRRDIDVVFEKMPKKAQISLGISEKYRPEYNVNHLPWLQLVSGEYAFPNFHDNIFVSAKKSKIQFKNYYDIDEIQRLMSLACDGYTHFLTIGSFPIDLLPLKLISSHGVASIFEVNSSSGKSCD